MTVTIAEFTTNHMGSLNLLLEMVDRAALAGADFIKMQKKDVGSFYSKEKLRGKFDSPFGKTYHDYRKLFEFDKEQWDIFDRRCQRRGIKWFTTIQDMLSIDFFKAYNLPMVKVASCNLHNIELIQAIQGEFPGIPFVISLGGAELDEIDGLVARFKGRDLILQHCVSTYPCPYGDLRLGNIPFLIDRYKDKPWVKIGYSGHEVGVWPSVVAAQMGAHTVERHFCLSRHSFVHHIECSLEPDEFAGMAAAIRSLPAVTSFGFGMQDSEKRFLNEGAYGTDFLGSESEMS